MEKIRKLFGEVNLSWKKLIIFATIVAIYTAIMALLPITRNTSFEDISISFEVWILFGIFIIMNSKSAKDSALKCFVFFLISQPLIYLIQVPFNPYGWGIFVFYRTWFIWTLLTIPMGFIGYYMKQDKWWGTLILAPMLLLLGIHAMGFLGETMLSFPHHLLSFLFCIASMILYPFIIFKDKKAKIIGIIISALIIIAVLGLTFFNRTEYNTTILISSDEPEGIAFDDSYNVYLKDDKYGKVYISLDKNIEEYMVNASFRKLGKTEFTLESPSGEKTVFEIDIKRNSYDIKQIDPPSNENIVGDNWKLENVKITVKEDSITKTGATIVIEDKNDQPKAWGISFELQMLGDNEWVDLMTKELISWIEIAIEPDENGITEIDCDWSSLYGELNAGTYRIVKTVGIDKVYGEPFKID